MCKKILSFLLVGICLIATLTPIRALENSEDIGLTCDYAVAIDAKSGLVLYNKNMDERMLILYGKLELPQLILKLERQLHMKIYYMALFYQVGRMQLEL